MPSSPKTRAGWPVAASTRVIRTSETGVPSRLSKAMPNGSTRMSTAPWTKGVPPGSSLSMRVSASSGCAERRQSPAPGGPVVVSMMPMKRPLSALVSMRTISSRSPRLVSMNAWIVSIAWLSRLADGRSTARMIGRPARSVAGRDHLVGRKRRRRRRPAAFRACAWPGGAARAAQERGREEAVGQAERLEDARRSTA